MTKRYTDYSQLPLTLNANDIACALGISRANAYFLFHAEDFPTLRIGRRLMVGKTDFIEWMKNRQGGVA